MDSRDLRESGERLDLALEELRWRLDWLLLDRDAVPIDEVRKLAVRFRLACMGHAAAVLEATQGARPDQTIAGVVETFEGILQRTLDELVLVRIAVDRLEISADPGPLVKAVDSFSATAAALFEAERVFVATYATTLFATERW